MQVPDRDHTNRLGIDGMLCVGSIDSFAEHTGFAKMPPVTSKWVTLGISLKCDPALGPDDGLAPVVLCELAS